MNKVAPEKLSCPVLGTEQADKWREISSAIWSQSGDELTWRDPVKSVAVTLFDQPRWLDASFLYDADGSALFERITELPEYYLTRQESQILDRHSAEIIERAGAGQLVELGAGYSVKSRFLLRRLQEFSDHPAFVPVDVSRTALEAARDNLKKEFPDIRFYGLHASYEEGLRALDCGNRLVAFLGSSLGNLLRTDLLRFLDCLAASLRPGDAFLLGVDLVKDPDLIKAAYDDSEGVTRRFILNVLNHLNREVGTDFDPDQFRYRPRYNPVWNQMEMYLESVSDQRVSFPEPWGPFYWMKGEQVLVEVSRKFEVERLCRQLMAYGFRRIQTYTDSRRWFALVLFRKEER